MNLAETRTHSPILNKPKEKKSRKPIKKVSKVRAALNREYMKLRAEFLAAHPFCEYWLAENGIKQCDVLLGRAINRAWQNAPASTECHHKKGRGKYLLDTSTWMAVSPEGHRAIHADPATSYAKGYMQPRR